MFRKTQDINDICREREQMLSQLRCSKRMYMLNEKRNNIVSYNSFDDVSNVYPDLKSNHKLIGIVEMIKNKFDYSLIYCIFALKNNHFLMSGFDTFEEINDVITDFDNYKYMIIIGCHKYIYIDNRFDLDVLIKNNTKIFEWYDDKLTLFDDTFNELIENERISKYYTNILEEARNYVKETYDDYCIPTLLELDVTNGCSNYNAIYNDHKKYEIINEIDLLNLNIVALKNSINLNKYKYVGALIISNSDAINHELQLIQIDNLKQLERLKRYIDCDPYIYKSI